MGIDVHRNFCQIAIIYKEGKAIREEKIRTEAIVAVARKLLTYVYRILEAKVPYNR